jgi:hypothetical protein
MSSTPTGMAASSSSNTAFAMARMSRSSSSVKRDPAWYGCQLIFYVFFLVAMRYRDFRKLKYPGRSRIVIR